jgi:predicted SAM-dependent methyltransferase
MRRGPSSETLPPCKNTFDSRAGSSKSSPLSHNLVGGARCRPTLAARSISKGLAAALDGLRRELYIAKRHKAALKDVRRCLESSDKRLNLGCGKNYKPEWINVDLFRSPSDLSLDLREPWPFEDGSITHVYCEHLLEHFHLHQAYDFLSEALRVLKPSGIFDLGVPDTEWPIRAYGNPVDSYWLFARSVHPTWCETQLHHINYHFRQKAEHKYAWDYDSLSSALQSRGFINIVRRVFDPALDSESRRIETLYLRASKP